MARLVQIILLFALCFLAGAFASLDLSYGDDADLYSFVTRPEIRAPRFQVKKYYSDKSEITPGYWFTAPYARITQEKHAVLYYQACQTGPAIYDNDGELVWSGACQFKNQNAHDFRMWTFNGTIYMSAILYTYRAIGDTSGHGVIMDSSYNVVRNITAPAELTVWNMHELHLSDEGRRARFMTWNAQLGDISSMKMEGVNAGWVGDIGFLEQDLVQNKPLFQWWAAGSGEISYTESKVPVANVQGPWPRAWDWIHANSIDQNAEGDYIFSGRFTDTIYKISRTTGKLLWRLGGANSTFDQDFIFSRQHDARALSINATHEIITLFDNAGDENTEFTTPSSAKLIALDRQRYTATLLSVIPRPDGNMTRLRGNYQTLHNGHHFVCWSENSYVSEHAPDGRVLLEARFASRRFSTYRAYKFDFTGVPSDPPDVVAVAHGVSREKSTTAVYVSWNGATEVVRWRVREAESKGLVGEGRKSGFETLLYVDGFVGRVVVEAIDASGDVIGTSRVVAVRIPDAWTSEGYVITEGPSLGAVDTDDDWDNHRDWLERAGSFRVKQKLMEMNGRLWIVPLASGGMFCAVMARRFLVAKTTRRWISLRK